MGAVLQCPKPLPAPFFLVSVARLLQFSSMDSGSSSAGTCTLRKRHPGEPAYVPGFAWQRTDRSRIRSRGPLTRQVMTSEWVRRRETEIEAAVASRQPVQGMAELQRRLQDAGDTVTQGRTISCQTRTLSRFKSSIVNFLFLLTMIDTFNHFN